MTTTTTDLGGGGSNAGGLRVGVQKFGTFLSNMVMPNIAAFIAWGFITALFIEVGWLPNLGIGDSPDSWIAQIGGWGDFAGGGIVGPMIVYLLPLLIGYTGGYNIYKTRGGVIGAIATMGAITGGGVPMFMGAMVMGPLGGWSMKKLDALWSHKIRPGFEMLVNNFSGGIWGLILAVFGFFVMANIVERVANVLGNGVDFLVENSLLPLTSVIIEPAKVLFLNNALNQGVLTPLGLTEAQESGKSILFLLEANPAAGAGLLLAFMFFGKGLAKGSAPGAFIIHFFGGIHEVYFPYVLMKPVLLVAMIAGGMSQIFVNVLFDSGLRAPAAPGSIIAVYANTASGSYVGVTLSVIAGAAVTFAVASVLLKLDRTEEDDLLGATEAMKATKAQGKGSAAPAAAAGAAGGAAAGAAAVGAGTTTKTIHNIVFACDAGMGSSAMGASVLRRKIEAAGFTDVTVVNKAISNLTDDVDVVISHQDLTTRAAQATPSATHYSVDNFMASPVYDEVVELVQRNNGGDGGDGSAAAAAAPAAAASTGGGADDVLAREAIVLGGNAGNRDDAITEAGQLLVASGAVDASYVDAMHERESSVSTHMGNLLAIPHGTNEAKDSIRHTAMSYVHYPNGIDWNGKQAEFVIGIAGAGKDHLKLLSKLAAIFTDDEQVARLRAAGSPDEVLAVLDSVRA